MPPPARERSELRVFPDQFRADFRGIWPAAGQVGEVFGQICESLGQVLGYLGRVLEFLGQDCGHLGQLCGFLGPECGCFGRVFPASAKSAESLPNFVEVSSQSLAIFGRGRTSSTQSIADLAKFSDSSWQLPVSRAREISSLAKPIGFPTYSAPISPTGKSFSARRSR
jgi:hypothetical protein